MKLSTLVAATSLMLLTLGASAQEATIRKNLAERFPAVPKADEITKTPMPGLYEVRYNGTELVYTDAEANFLIQGTLIDARAKRNLTEERIEKLTAVEFSALPVKDAFTIVRGDGSRKIAVFEDPNCGYCKRFERDLQKVNNVTIYMFLYPILAADSSDKSRSVWCAKDKAKAWQDWMVRDQALPAATCESAQPMLARNLEFGRRHKITGTPTMYFVNGTRVPGAIDAAEIERNLANVASAAKP